jgi:dipeptidyl aminopeptidase/acylaminoacyl peptidase
MSRLLLSVALLLLLMAPGSAFTRASPVKPLSMDEMLRLEGIGQVAILPDATIIYEYLPPYKERTSFAFDERRAASRIMVVDPGSTTPRPLIEHEKERGYMIASISPAGSRLVVLANSSATSSAEVVEIKTGKRTALKHTPYADYFDGSGIAWLSETKLILSAASSGHRSLITGTRIAVVDSLNQRWRAAFNGAVSADVVSSRPVPIDARPIAGKLILVDLVNGQERVAAEGLLTNIVISPDKRHAVAIRRLGLGGVSSADRGVRREAEFRSKILILDLLNRVSVPSTFPCAECEVSPDSVRWSADSSYLSFLARDFGSRWQSGHYYSYDLKSGALKAYDVKAAALRPGFGEDLQPYPAVPLEGGLAIPVTQNGSNSWILMQASGRTRILTDGLEGVEPQAVTFELAHVVLRNGNELWRIGADGVKANLGQALPNRTRIWPAGLDGSGTDATRPLTAAFIEFGTVERHVASVSLVSGQTVTLGKLLPSERVVATSTSGAQAVAMRVDESGLQLRRVDAVRDASPFVHINKFFSEIRWPTKQALIYRAGSRELTACVYSTAPKQEMPKRPIIVLLYPEIDASRRCTSDKAASSGISLSLELGEPHYYGPEYLASLGYTVVVPSTPRDLINRDDEALAGLSDTVIPAVDAAGAQGFGDPSRVGLFGLSQGGFSALKVLTQSQRFSAAVALFSNADFASDYGQFGTSRSVLAPQIFAAGRSIWYSVGTMGAKKTPWEDPQWFVRSSPYFQASKIRTPLLLAQSDLDVNFPMGQFDELFTSLYMQRREVDYVRYWGEGHGVKSPGNMLDLDRRVRDLFSQRLSHSETTAARLDN